MRKIMLVLVITLAAPAALQAQVRLGPFLGYGERLGLWGLGVHTEVMLNDRFGVSPIFIQYFPKQLGSTYRKTAWELDLNVNYHVLTGEVASLYGLGGVTYTKIRIRDQNLLTDQLESDGNIGLNAGLGTLFRINNILPFAEAKYTLGGYSQLTVFVGVKVELGGNTLVDDY